MSEIRENDINKAKAEADEDAENLSQFLGIDELGEIDSNKKPLKLKAEDVIFLCSDGISSVLPEENISRALRRRPTEACLELKAALENLADPKQDNYTGIVIACRN